MKRLLSCLLFVLLFTACTRASNTPPPVTQALPPPPSVEPSPTAAATLTVPAPTAEAKVTLRRGVNFGNMLEAPTEGAWGLKVEEEYFDLVKQAGFDFVRLPINWKAHTTYTGHDDGDVSYEIDPAFFDRIDTIVQWALERDLSIILDFHNYEDLMTNPNGEQFWFLWRQIAEHYRDFPPQVLFELANEPHGELTASQWNFYSANALQIVRETNPTRDVIIGPVDWNSAGKLSTLSLPNDPHVILTFHYYQPFPFTHQGTEWMGDESQKWLGTTWDGTEDEQNPVFRTFDSVQDWAAQHRVRVLLGEFGAYHTAPTDSRLRWTTFIREQAEAHGFAWAYWDFGSGFGVYDPATHTWQAELVKALIP
jgi:endoglucanase